MAFRRIYDLSKGVTSPLLCSRLKLTSTSNGGDPVGKILHRNNGSWHCSSMACTTHSKKFIDHQILFRINGISIQSKRHYNKKKTVKIPPTKTLRFDYAGDFGSLKEFSANEPKLGYEDVNGILDADQPDSIKKIFSMEFSKKNEIKEKHIQELSKEVQFHPADSDSIEIRITYLTVMIRNQMDHVQKFRKDKCAKAQLVGRIQARKKYLRMLRQLDYERFEYIMEKLKIKYIPTPEYNFKETRKGRLKREHKEAAYAMISEKLQQFKQQLQEEKDTFLKYKEETLSQIMKDLEELSENRDKELTELYEMVAEQKVDLVTT